MALPKTFRDVEAGWGKDNSSLECELLLHDFFRREEGYSTENPLILCRDGGLMALYSMDGLDPETMDEDARDSARKTSCDWRPCELPVHCPSRAPVPRALRRRSQRRSRQASAH